MRYVRLALVVFALLPGGVAAQTDTEPDEPNVELGKVETFGPQVRVW